MQSRKSLILVLIILCAILQATLLDLIQIFNTKPDILLILIVFFSLYYGRSYGLIVGAVCALFAEATSNVPSGILLFTYSLAGLVLGHLSKWIDAFSLDRSFKFWKQIFFGEICAAFIFSFIIYLFLFFLFPASNINLSLGRALIFIILPASLYTAITAPILFSFLKTVLNFNPSTTL